MIKLNKNVALFAFIVFVNLLLILFFMNKRDGMHVDEQFSYGHANSSIGAFMFEGATHDFKLVDGVPERWIDTKLYNDYFTVKEDSRFSYKDIVKKLSFDVHPPLYYFILHTISSFYPETFNKWHGLSINIICFILISIGIFKLSKLFFKDEKYILLPMILWGFSNIGISTAMFIRMYALQTVLLTMLIYETVKIIKNNEFSNKSMLLIFIYSFLGILTQYNSIFYSFFLTAITSIFLLARKQYRILLKYDAIMLMSVLFLFVAFYPAYNVLLHSSRGTGSIDSLISKLKNPIEVLDLEFYRFIKIYLCDFFNSKLQLNFGAISCGIVLFYTFKFRNEVMKKEIKILYYFSLLMTAVFAFLQPVGALFLLFLFNLCKKFFVVRSENNECHYILYWSISYILTSSLFVFVTMPYMGDFETRYIMPIMPFVAVVTVCLLAKTGNVLKLKEKYVFFILALFVVFNSYETKFGQNSSFRMRNTIETNNFIKNIKEKDVFVIQNRGGLLYFIERGYYLQNANRVYLETELTDSNLIKEIEKNRNIDVLILEQSVFEKFYEKPDFFDLNPNMKDILSFVSDIIISERTYKLYRVKQK